MYYLCTRFKVVLGILTFQEVLKFNNLRSNSALFYIQKQETTFEFLMKNECRFAYYSQHVGVSHLIL